MEIQIQSQININEFVNFQLAANYKKPLFIISSIFGIYFLIISILNLNDYQNYFNLSHTVSLLLGLYIIGFFPIMIIFKSRKLYNTNKSLQETIHYSFNEKSMKVLADTFNHEREYESIYKIKELRKWILIYQNNIVFSMIPKSSFSDEQLITFWELISKKSEIKIEKLKK